MNATAGSFGGTSTRVPGLPCAQPLVADALGGSTAIRALGANLPQAAAKIDRAPAEFRAILRSDTTLRVDECGQTFVVDPAMTAGLADDPSAPDPAGSPAASGSAFTLNSRPGSLRTIFLDFDGHEIVGTAWNSAAHPDVFAAPFDTDGSPGSFSAAEEATIHSVWLRVSEDFAPFDVNVTTQDPGQAAITRSNANDAVYGTRALVTMDGELWHALCPNNCGGIAYVNAFDKTSQHDAVQPALIFQQALFGASATPKLIAEVISHEVGHNLDLLHDGTASSGYYLGQGVWAPIMGAGYYKPVSQWSKGEYAEANMRQDDLAVIADQGPALLTDDHANSATHAAALGYGGAAVEGLIGNRTDTDWFRFTVPTGAGATAVTVTPQAVGGDLDASLTLYDGTGALVLAANPPVAMSGSDRATGLGASLTRTLASGTYTAKVDGVGSGTASTTGYSDYASLGRYAVSVGATTAAPTALPSSWSGTLRAAVSAMTVRSETATGYSSAKFPLVDADQDCRNIRAEVLAAESSPAVQWTTARHCVVRAGQWFSSFDRRTLTSAKNVSAVWTVPLAEAWQSGASSWTPDRRQAYANDLGDSRTLLAVSSASAGSRADREPTGWLPASASRCGYLAEWVAVKLRWGLSTDAAEQSRLASLAAGCSATNVTVHRG